ncbi:GntR family transcriptional regulator [Streptomyces sp. NPDC057910]|uniref:GntR family transcriptional regulator n=1 Tax=Streptomyces sp. NPDC057910 TaxID=3346278 RepID=UPI0036E165B3
MCAKSRVSQQLSTAGPPREEARPLYQELADDLATRLVRPLQADTVPSPLRIARLYRVPLSTAQFVRRATLTRLRPPVAAPVAPPGPPAWWLVAEDLRLRVRAGDFPDRVPARPRLTAEYRVGIDTVSKAIQQLVEDQLLEVRGTRGTYVRDVHPSSDQEQP